MTTPQGGPGTTTQHALDELRRAIVAGRYRPGQRVGQEEIAERLGVSLAPVREALRALEQEGQVVYRPRRGYFITELHVEDLQEIYALRALLEERAVRHALPTLDDDALERIELAARDCAAAAERGDVAAELEANRRFHFGMLESPDQTHTMRLDPAAVGFHRGVPRHVLQLAGRAQKDHRGPRRNSRRRAPQGCRQGRRRAQRAPGTGPARAHSQSSAVDDLDLQ